MVEICVRILREGIRMILWIGMVGRNVERRLKVWMHGWHKNDKLREENNLWLLRNVWESQVGRRIKEKENFWMLREKGSRGGGTDEMIEKFMRDGRWWWVVVTMWEGVWERESVKLCLNICTWSDRLEWDLETKSTSMLVLPHHCHPHPSREGMTNPDDAMSWWKHSTAEWKGTCFMECEGE